jgi:hypothetical protein
MIPELEWQVQSLPSLKHARDFRVISEIQKAV